MIGGKPPKPDSLQARVFEHSDLQHLGSIKDDVPPALRASQLRRMAGEMLARADRLEAGETADDETGQHIGLDDARKSWTVGKSDLTARAGFMLDVCTWRDRCLGKRFVADMPLRILLMLYLARLSEAAVTVRDLASALDCEAFELGIPLEELRQAGYLQVEGDGERINPDIVLAGPALIRITRFLTDKQDGRLSLRWPLSF